MPRCPHCGEPVRAGQERCFACGQNVRARRREAGSGPGGRTILLLVLLLAVGIGGTIVVLAQRPKQRARQAEEEELARIQDSVRAANRAQRAERRAARPDKATARLNLDLDRAEDRFLVLQGRVVVGKPTPEQQKLISEIQSSIGQLRGRIQAIDGQPRDDARRRAEEEIKDGMRNLKSLVTKLSRAPRNRPATPGTP